MGATVQNRFRRWGHSLSTSTDGTGFGPLGQAPPIGGGAVPSAGTFGVDGYLLTAEGTALQEIAGQLPVEAVKLFQPSDGAVSGLVGWRTAAALDRCTEAWAALLKRFGSALDGAGTNMVTTALNYQAANAAVQQHLRRLYGPFGVEP